MSFTRGAGVLLHPTSLPGSYGIGDLGPEAYKFIDFLSETGQKYWQILPITHPGMGELPYQSYSVFACNPYLISPDILVDWNLLRKSDLENTPQFDLDRVEFKKVLEFKNKLFQKGFDNFIDQKNLEFEFNSFCDVQGWWLEDYSLFMAIKDSQNGKPWFEWDPGLKNKDLETIKKFKQELNQNIMYHEFLQFIFYKQWFQLKKYCNNKGIRIIGDIPIFVSHDSADVWSNPGLFFLDQEKNLKYMAGVPPDYFSETGQLWGNPLYDWGKMKKNNYEWWIARIRVTMALVDIIRIDHFRGFESYWRIPAGEETAVNGTWEKGPGADFFIVMDSEVGRIPVIAEDLGVITEEIIQLRDQFGFPGMKVLQFAFSGPDNEYLPHNFKNNFVVYTGTHDNNTTVGWFHPETEKPMLDPRIRKREIEFALKYLGTDGKAINWDMIRLAFSSVADLAIIPMQDILGLGSEARMNIPGTAEGNWDWRYIKNQLTDNQISRLKSLTEIYLR